MRRAALGGRPTGRDRDRGLRGRAGRGGGGLVGERFHPGDEAFGVGPFVALSGAGQRQPSDQLKAGTQDAHGRIGRGGAGGNEMPFEQLDVGRHAGTDAVDAAGGDHVGEVVAAVGGSAEPGTGPGHGRVAGGGAAVGPQRRLKPLVVETLGARWIATTVAYLGSGSTRSREAGQTKNLPEQGFCDGTPPGTRTLNPRIKRCPQRFSERFGSVWIYALTCRFASGSVQACSGCRDRIGIAIGIVRPRRGTDGAPLG